MPSRRRRLRAAGSGQKVRAALDGDERTPSPAVLSPPPHLSFRRLWTPTSARPAASRVALSLDARQPVSSLSARVYARASQEIVARRGGEEGPNPFVMERFQSVISSLFQQARGRQGCAPARRGLETLKGGR